MAFGTGKPPVISPQQRLILSFSEIPRPIDHKSKKIDFIVKIQTGVKLQQWARDIELWSKVDGTRTRS